MQVGRTLWFGVILVIALCGRHVIAAKPTILVVESYNVEMEWDASYKQALEEALGKKYKLEYFQMDTKRLPKDEHAAMADKAWARYQALQPVLVILGDDAALKFLAKRLGATSTPVVYLGINNNPREYFDANVIKNITGVLERPVLKRNIAFAHEILPNAKRALVLFDTDVTSQVVLRETFGGQHQLVINGVNVDLKLIGDWDVWQNEVLNAKQNYDMIFVGLYQALHDRVGKSVNTTHEVARWTSEHSPVPAFGFWDFAVGPDKTIGGLVLYGREQGKAAAEIALKILSGTPPAQIYPVTADRGHFLFSKRQLERYNIVLPAVIASESSFTQ
jgi:ABC-type uncharacterized transport system substrate-binding protein